MSGVHPQWTRTKKGGQFLSPRRDALTSLEQSRNSAIQCFEFTHEPAFRMLKRQVERMSADPSSVDAMSYMDLVRSGAEAGLVRDVARFRDYREKRHVTSHTYDVRQAEKIVAVLEDFRDDVRHLLPELERRNADAD